MRSRCNIIIIPELCSAEVQGKILHLCKMLKAKGLIPHDIVLEQRGFNIKNDNLFFVTLDKNTMYNLRNLMSRINPKCSHIIVVPINEENYFDFAIEYNICNIIHLKRLNEVMLQAILTDFFKKKLCLDSFFKKEDSIFDKNYSLTGEISMLRLVENSFADFINQIESSIRNTFIINCHELIANAIAYGVLGITAYSRDRIGHEAIDYKSINIPSGKDVQIRLALSNERYGISVKDFGGLLTTQRILERIRRQSVVAGETIPQGIEDYTGRGLAILSHHGLLVFAIKPGEFTEVSLISRLETAIEKKPISILATEL
ncbi:MAG: hypothetical protein FWC26_04990 [Fibromonadales bacterium]|nr:hypothetical protein [Fibromonadales bacterium]